MKKNKFLKLASGLLMLVLITCCAVSGTFAKYVTTGSATDTARVAKWGIELAVTGNEASFSTTEGTSPNFTVKSADTDKVVAPGTSGTLFSFTITGTPEVAYKMTVSFNFTKEIKLVAGDYLDHTTANSDTDTFNLASDYYPVKYVLTTPDSTVNCATLADLKAALEALTTSTVAAGTTVAGAGTYTVTWEWAFGQNNQADTFLGNEVTLQEIAYSFSIEVTQVD